MTSSTSGSGGSAWGHLALLVVVTVVVTVVVAGCQSPPPARRGVPAGSGFPVPTSSTEEGPHPSYSPTVGPTRLGTRALPGGGRVLTDHRGLTAYVTDSFPASQVVPRCKGVCTNIWHPLVVGSASVRSTVAGVPAITFETLPAARRAASAHDQRAPRLHVRGRQGARPDPRAALPYRQRDR